jgi:hypothetical protein
MGQSSYPEVLPPGWVKRYTYEADLESSFAELDPVPHFHARTMQGRIRSLQGLIPAAKDLLDEATDRAASSEESVGNLVRQFLLEVYRFDHALFDAPLETGLEIPSLDVPPVSDAVLERYPEVRYVLSVRRSTEARLRLHTGEVEQAKAIYEELRDDTNAHQQSAFMLGEVYLGLAATYYAIDDDDAVDLNLQNAEFVPVTTDQTLNQAGIAARLAAFYGFLENHEKANEWKVFLEGLKCPRSTKESFLRFAVRMRDRCVQLGRAVVL